MRRRALCEEAGLGRTSKSTVATICAELHERFEAFKRRDLYGIKLVVLFLDAIVRHEALLDRAGCKTPPLGCHSGPVKLRAA